MIASDFPTLLYCFPVTFAGSLNKDCKTFVRSSQLLVEYVTYHWKHCTKLCGMHLSAYEQFAHGIFSHPTYPLYNGHIKCRSYATHTLRTRPMAFGISYFQSTFPLWLNWQYAHFGFFPVHSFFCSARRSPVTKPDKYPVMMEVQIDVGDPELVIVEDIYNANSSSLKLTVR